MGVCLFFLDGGQAKKYCVCNVEMFRWFKALLTMFFIIILLIIIILTALRLRRMVVTVDFLATDIFMTQMQP